MIKSNDMKNGSRTRTFFATTNEQKTKKSPLIETTQQQSPLLTPPPSPISTLSPPSKTKTSRINGFHGFFQLFRKSKFKFNSNSNQNKTPISEIGEEFKQLEIKTESCISKQPSQCEHTMINFNIDQLISPSDSSESSICKKNSLNAFIKYKAKYSIYSLGVPSLIIARKLLPSNAYLYGL